VTGSACVLYNYLRLLSVPASMLQHLHQFLNMALRATLDLRPTRLH
jgi:hypothetical protein